MSSAAPTRRRLGMIVNPLAGIGGSVALKGSDGAETVAAARARGAVPQAPERASRALRTLAETLGDIELLTAPGAMGADVARAAGLRVRTMGQTTAAATTAADTRAAAAAMYEAGIDLLLFAGGDGTARDIHDVIGDQLPLLGIPAGVKMHSGVFAGSPEAAGRGVAAFVTDGPRIKLRQAEIADVDEQALRGGRVASVLYGSALVPDLPRIVLPAKAGSRTRPAAALEALCHAVAAELEPDCLYLIGPGTTTSLVLAALGQQGTLLGVDAVHDGLVVGRDLTEAEILSLIDGSDSARLIVGLIGGQGSLLGRGNKQLGPAVLRRISPEAIMILSSADKLLALDPSTLWVDTGDAELDTRLSGYVRVHVGPRRQIVIKVSS
jgi:predicted polyphosphate/ATP-dependent NAD kinase